MSADESVGEKRGGDVDAISIDLSDAADRWQYTCPEGHRDWRPTNSHIYCDTCAKRDLDADHWAIVDQCDETEIPWSAVTVTD